MAATPVVNSNFSLNLLQQRELDDAFYSSLDSDEEKEENEKNNMLIRPIQKKITRLNTIKQNDIFSAEKRKNIIEKMSELNRLHQKKEREMKNSPVTWGLVYNILFCDYFNMLKYKKNYPNDNDNKDIVFNINEVELRVKKVIDKIEGRKFKIVTNESKKEKDKASKIGLSSVKWVDASLFSIIKQKTIVPSEANNFIPSYMKAFNNYIDKEITNKKKDTNMKFGNNPSKYVSSNLIKKPTLSSFVGISKRLSHSNIAVLVSNNNIVSAFPNVKKNDVNSEPATPFIKNRIVHKQTKSMKEFTIPNQTESTTNTNMNSNTKPLSDNETQNMIQTANNNFKEKNGVSKKYKDILNNNKTLRKLIKKYPQYENDIMNIKNNFMTYDIELNKDENLFMDPLNSMNRHFIDFHYDSEAQKSAKLNKKYQVKDKILLQAKKIDSFINDFNSLMNNEEVKRECASQLI